MSQPGIEPGPPRWEASTPINRKEPFEQLVNSYSEHIHMSVRPVEATLPFEKEDFLTKNYAIRLTTMVFVFAMI